MMLRRPPSELLYTLCYTYYPVLHHDSVDSMVPQAITAPYLPDHILQVMVCQSHH